MPNTSAPAPSPEEQVQVNLTEPAHPHDPGARAKLPHERDQSTAMTGGEKSAEMEQAYKDLKRGLRDTDARGPDGRPQQPPPSSGTG